MNWLTFALMTVVCWGLYGIFLHNGQVAMADKTNALYKSFLFVGLAYFLTAVIAPLGMLMARGADWNFPKAGMGWSLFAGILGALGAFGVLLAFAADGKPGYVMAIVFAGAPIVNAVTAILLHPPEGGVATIKPQFFLGILLAALGAALVVYYKPKPPAPKSAVVSEASSSPNSSRL